MIGTLENGAMLSVHIEGGKRNGSGLQIDITGMTGDLKIWNSKSFTNTEDNIVEGGQGNGDKLVRLPILRLTHFSRRRRSMCACRIWRTCMRHARDRMEGMHLAPDFADAVRMHEVINAITEVAASGQTTEVVTSTAAHKR